jgi:hypothetical protein
MRRPIRQGAKMADDPSLPPRRTLDRTDLLADPRVVAHYRDVLRERHHRTGTGADARCSCGELYSRCTVAARIRLFPAPVYPTPSGPSRWFG